MEAKRRRLAQASARDVLIATYEQLREKLQDDGYPIDSDPAKASKQKFRMSVIRRMLRDKTNGERVSRADQNLLRQQAGAQWVLLESWEKLRLLLTWAQEDDVTIDLKWTYVQFATVACRDLVLKTVAQRQEYSKEKVFWHGSMVLLTYHKEAWVLEGGVADIQPDDDVTRVADRLQQQPSVLQLWEDFVGEVKDMTQRLKFQHWSCCLELCPKTLEQKRTARLHFHVALEAEKEVAISSAQWLAVMGVSPFRSGGSGSSLALLFGSQRGGRWENSSAALHYDCQAKKNGQLFSAGSLSAHLDCFREVPVGPAAAHFIQAGHGRGLSRFPQLLLGGQDEPRELGSGETA